MPICLIERFNNVVRSSPPAANLGNSSFRFIPESCVHVNQRATAFAARPDACTNGGSCGLIASFLAHGLRGEVTCEAEAPERSDSGNPPPGLVQ